MEAAFSYNVKVGRAASMLRAGPYKTKIPNCGEINISSRPFETYEECEKSLNGLMMTLTRVEGKSADKNMVIVSKVNPALDESGKKHADAASWDEHTILRVYVADPEELKKATLKYHIVGQIKSAINVASLKVELITE